MERESDLEERMNSFGPKERTREQGVAKAWAPVDIY